MRRPDAGRLSDGRVQHVGCRALGAEYRISKIPGFRTTTITLSRSFEEHDVRGPRRSGACECYLLPETVSRRPIFPGSRASCRSASASSQAARTPCAASHLSRPVRVSSSCRRESSAQQWRSGHARSVHGAVRWKCSRGGDLRRRAIPLSDSVRAVPFYDGGNVFRRVGDIFNPPAVPANDPFTANLRAVWSHTVGLGLRIKTPIGGEFGVDYGWLLNPPRFLIPQAVGQTPVYRLGRKPGPLPILAGLLKLSLATVLGSRRKCLLNISSEARMPERTHLFRSNLNLSLLKLCGFRPIRRPGLIFRYGVFRHFHWPGSSRGVVVQEAVPGRSAACPAPPSPHEPPAAGETPWSCTSPCRPR